METQVFVTGLGSFNRRRTGWEIHADRAEKVSLLPKNIAQVCSGEYVSTALTENGDVFLWGFLDGVSYKLPTRVPSICSVVQIACGMRHVILLTSIYF
jgi:alpha-tubulin suppressor-like RCC1 family protein